MEILLIAAIVIALVFVWLNRPSTPSQQTYSIRIIDKGKGMESDRTEIYITEAAWEKRRSMEKTTAESELPPPG